LHVGSSRTDCHKFFAGLLKIDTGSGYGYGYGVAKDFAGAEELFFSIKVGLAPMLSQGIMKDMEQTAQSRVILLLDLDCFYAQCETIRLGLDQKMPMALLQVSLYISRLTDMKHSLYILT
jgi:hypothetical protein